MATVITPPAPIAERVAALLAQMTLPEKVGQMTQVEKNSINKEDITHYSLGSLLSGGGGYPATNTAAAWREMVSDFQQYALQSRLGIPLIYGVDAVHGHNNVYGATIFPHNIGLGATRNAGLVERIGRATAVEIAATGVHWDFAPAVSIPRDIRWGRTYEGYGEETALVGELGAAYVRGLQGDLGSSTGVLASVKHFVGDGGTKWGTTTHYPWLSGHTWFDAEGIHWQIDQGVTDIDEATLRAVHLPPYAAAIAAGARNIMVSYSSWGGLKMHAQRYLLTDVLKGELGFTGFLVTDWMAVDQIDTDFQAAVVASINAGVDMVMVPFRYERFINTLLTAVAQEQIPLARIDDAVSRILTVKLEMNLFEDPFMGEGELASVGCADHRAIAREAVQQSAVLLQNNGGLLPLNPQDGAHILVAGVGADDLGMQCGGWTIEWMGKRGRSTEGTTILDGIRAIAGQGVRYDITAETADRASIGIVVLGEEPYAEGQGDSNDLTLSTADIALLERMRGLCAKLVVVLISGRPLLITDQLPLMDAFVAAWLPGTEGQGVADVLFGAVPFTGRLPHAWPRTTAHIPRGHGPAADDVLWPLGAGL